MIDCICLGSIPLCSAARVKASCINPYIPLTPETDELGITPYIFDLPATEYTPKLWSTSTDLPLKGFKKATATACVSIVVCPSGDIGDIILLKKLLTLCLSPRDIDICCND